MNAIDINKSVPRDQWSEFFDLFSNGNRGRRISIEMITSDLGNENLIQNAPLRALIYDRPDKGNNLAIEVGTNEVTYSHTVDAPTEVWTGQSASGVMMALQIADTAGTKTLIQLQAD